MTETKRPDRPARFTLFLPITDEAPTPPDGEYADILEALAANAEERMRIDPITRVILCEALRTRIVFDAIACAPAPKDTHELQPSASAKYCWLIRGIVQDAPEYSGACVDDMISARTADCMGVLAAWICASESCVQGFAEPLALTWTSTGDDDDIQCVSPSTGGDT
jgi:hypothetical protein